MQSRKLVFATNNLHKLTEARSILADQYSILSLSDINCFDEIEETEDTLEGNALLKASYVHRNFRIDCFSDDTGLEVEALHGMPGVYSARYAGPEHDFMANMQKLLSELGNHSNRNARFRTVIALILNDKQYCFEGILEGKITREPEGLNGFGYDPIFIPKGHELTLAQMSPEQKNLISHRAMAMFNLISFLKSCNDLM